MVNNDAEGRMYAIFRSSSVFWPISITLVFSILRAFALGAAPSLFEILVICLSTVLLYICQQVIVIKNRIDEVMNQRKTEKYLASMAKDSIFAFEKFSEVNNKLRHCDDFVEKCGRIAMDGFLNEFKVLNNSVSFVGERYSLQVFEEFWAYVSERKRISNIPMRAFVVHAVSARIWEGDYARRLIDHQKDFIDAGGSVYRVFIEIPSNDVDSRIYDRAISSMNEAGIHCCLLRLEHMPPEIADEEYGGYREFVIFDGLPLILIWRIDRYGRRIQGASVHLLQNFAEREYKKLAASWMDLIDRISQEDFDEINKLGGGSERFLVSDKTKLLSRSFQERASKGEMSISARNGGG